MGTNVAMDEVGIALRRLVEAKHDPHLKGLRKRKVVLQRWQDVEDAKREREGRRRAQEEEAYEDAA